MERIEKIFAKLFLFSLTAILTFIVLEMATNVYLVRFAGDSTFLRYASLHQLQTRAKSRAGLYSHHRYLGYYPTPNYVNGKIGTIHSGIAEKKSRILSPRGVSASFVWEGPLPIRR